MSLRHRPMREDGQIICFPKFDEGSQNGSGISISPSTCAGDLVEDNE